MVEKEWYKNEDGTINKEQISVLLNGLNSNLREFMLQRNKLVNKFNMEKRLSTNPVKKDLIGIEFGAYSDKDGIGWLNNRIESIRKDIKFLTKEVVSPNRIDRIDFNALKCVDPEPILQSFNIQFKRGHNLLMINCPFHNEKTASCAVYSGNRNGFYCFGCGASGDIITFVSKITGKNAVDSAKYIKQLT